MDKVAGNYLSIIRDSETALKWAFQRKTGAGGDTGADGNGDRADRGTLLFSI